MAEEHRACATGYFLADASITRTSPSASRRPTECVRWAAGQAKLAEVIARLPDGHDTRVGERGIQLSGGQRQCIGIGRELCKQAGVLVFD